jgi:hypothetical protein
VYEEGTGKGDINKCSMSLWSGFRWLKIGSSGDLLDVW